MQIAKSHTVPETEVIPMSRLTKSEQLRLDNVVSPYGQPERVFEKKVRHLSHILNCTEEEATHILLHNL